MTEKITQSHWADCEAWRERALNAEERLAKAEGSIAVLKQASEEAFGRQYDKSDGTDVGKLLLERYRLLNNAVEEFKEESLGKIDMADAIALNRALMLLGEFDEKHPEVIK